MVALFQIDETRTESVPLGSILLKTALIAPSFRYLECNGQAISRLTYADYFALVATTYGVGDGLTTFNIPDLREKGPHGRSVGFVLGTSEGSRNHTHIIGNLVHALTDPGHIHAVTDPTHTHPLTDPGHQHTVTDPGHTHGVTDPNHTHTVPASGTAAVVKLTGAENAADATHTHTSDASATGLTVNNQTVGFAATDAALLGFAATDAIATGLTVNNITTGITAADHIVAPATTPAPAVAMAYFVKVMN